MVERPPVICACGHDQSAHPVDNPYIGIDAIIGGMEYEQAVEVEYQHLITRPCMAVDCVCWQFTPLPFSEGTYIRTGVGEDGFEVVSFEPLGPSRLCVFERCVVAEDEARYRIRNMPDTTGIDEAEFKDNYDTWEFFDEYTDEELEYDSRIRFAAPDRWVVTIACVRCVVGWALSEFDPDEQPDLDD